jgi:hypothetical protein
MAEILMTVTSKGQVTIPSAVLFSFDRDFDRLAGLRRREPYGRSARHPRSVSNQPNEPPAAAEHAGSHDGQATH